MSEQCNNICPYSKYEHTVSLKHGHTDTDRLFPLFESFLSFRVVPNNLASHAHVILTSHIDCISAFPDINTIKNAVTRTHTQVAGR